MRAVINAAGYQKGMEPLIQLRPTPMLRIADKPILYHILEFLVRLKIRKIDIILSHLPELIEEKLADGKRWGLTLNYHLARQPEEPFSALIPVVQTWREKEEDVPILLCQGDCLPLIQSEKLPHPSDTLPILYMYPSGIWCGWGIFSTKCLSDIASTAPFENLTQLTHHSETASPFLSTGSCQDLLDSNIRFIQYDSARHFFPSTAHRVETGIWLSRGVSLHPGAVLVPPVFIGENCQIREGVHLGPNTIIEGNCIVDRHSAIQASLICQSSYVGENLEVSNSIVDRNLLVNLTHGTVLRVCDTFILSELSPLPLVISHFFAAAVSRLFALLLILILLPIYLYMRRRSSLVSQKMLELPAPEMRRNWKDFDWTCFAPKAGKSFSGFEVFFHRLPLLFTILRGEIHFVGVTPRSIEDVEKLPLDWQKLYLRSKVGLITLTDLDHGPSPSSDDRYAAEAVYAIQMGIVYDFKLFMRWLYKKVMM